MTYTCILVETVGDGPRKTGLIRLNRPKALNALCDPLMDELGEALAAFDADAGIGCIVLTGSEKAFCAGADIPSIKDLDFLSAHQGGLVSKNWEHVLKVKKPVLAAVAGYALGGGCELAMMCDTIYAAESAKFGQPEIKIGVIPGAGGTQRLPRWVGKAKAMDLLLTARMMDAQEALQAGLVARVFPTEGFLDEVLKVAELLNAQSAPALALMKEMVNQAFETPLTQGVQAERLAFHAMFGTHDQREGMTAFLEKRAPQWKHGS
ncbi:enoyl-CoA hydratase-related protein [Inhella crocodyli]|uniref:Enoyl-CoA hydratase n=1 Tax=Inhella crocodyli TaxID=2499851 RepID=A0A3S3TDH4_9BURK|nr:enoyl-CoA hydratase-related protein [Inhella crocodyli]RVT88612.1 enoyl-CoA hydratase [Inhella crocodyli]